MTTDAARPRAAHSAVDRAMRRAGGIALVVALTVAAAACGSSAHSAAKPGGKSAPVADTELEVTVELTAKGCAPEPASITAGHVDFTVTNKSADAVSEAELRTSDLSHILGEQENLTPGLSGGFSLNIQPGRYEINCPGASHAHWPFTVTGSATGPNPAANAQLEAAVRGYAAYVNQNVADLVQHTKTFCAAIDSGNLHAAELTYAPARVYYERIEPVAEIWGSLDTQIDGRWENPVTVASQFMGFHKLEQLLWENDTLAGAPALCAGLVQHEQALQKLVNAAQYSPLEMASGATDLINEAATAKITGEEERYSNTDFVVFKANVDGAMEVVHLFAPYLRTTDPSALTLIQRRDAAVTRLLGKYQADPGYENTGYVEYSTVFDNQRRPLAGAVNALAEALSQISDQVS